MKNKLGIGIVGSGTIAARLLAHLSLADVSDKIYLAGVCDPVPGRAEAAAVKYNVLKAYKSYEELLLDKKVDLVTICSPIGMHFEQGMMAVKAGKHVHFNKTMSVTYEEANTLITAAREKGVKMTASPGNMLWPTNQRKRKYILEGQLGRLVWAAASNGNVADYHLAEPERQDKNDVMSADPSWYFQKNGGGPLYDITVYAIHSVTGIIGPARSVTAVSSRMRDQFEFRGRTIPNEMDDFITMILEFDSNVYGLISALPTAEPKGMGGIFGAYYGLEGFIDEDGLNGKEDLKFEGDMLPHQFGAHIDMPEFHVYEDIMQLVDWVASDAKKPVCSVEHARHVIEIIEACCAAASSGNTVEIKSTFTPMTIDEITASLEQFGGKE